MSASHKLAELGIELPDVVAPLAAYVPAVRTGNLVYTAGQLPIVEGELLQTGKVGGDVNDEDAKALARVCGLNALAAVHALVVDVTADLAGLQQLALNDRKLTRGVDQVPGPDGRDVGRERCHHVGQFDA